MDEAPKEFRDGLADAVDASLNGRWSPAEWEQWRVRMAAMLPSEPLGAEFEAVYDANTDKLYTP